MRWFWIDRFTEFVSGSHAVAVKCVSLSEEPVDEYSPGYPYFPASLIVEGLAQTGGMLVAQQSDFEKRVVLAKITKARFLFQACPGDRMEFRTDIVSLQDGGGIVNGQVSVDGELMCEIDLTFAYLDDRFEGIELFEPAGFCRTMRCLRLFDVGVDSEGNPIRIPDYMLEAEAATIAAAG